MILVVGLNPAIDITLELDGELVVGATNRYQQQSAMLAGKGLNVVTSLASLGESAVYFGFVPRAEMGQFREHLAALKATPRLVPVPGLLRHNFKLHHDGIVTELNNWGTPVPVERQDELWQLFVREANGSSCIVLTGSVPPGVSPDIYRRMAAYAHENQIPLILDAGGSALAQGLQGKPLLAKPNMEELVYLVGGQELKLAARSLAKNYGVNICVSLGSNGSLLLADGSLSLLPGRELTVRTTVGAGDAMVAAFAWAIRRNWAWESAHSLAAAVAAHHIEVGWQPGDRLLEPNNLSKNIPLN